MCKCHDCGKFMRIEVGTPWKMVYSGVIPTPDREIFRCSSCKEKCGEFNPQHGIKPEFSCGVIQSAPEQKREG